MNSFVFVLNVFILNFVIVSASECTQSIHLVHNDCFVKHSVFFECIDNLFDPFSSIISQTSQMNMPNEYEYRSECHKSESNIYE